MTYYVYQVLSKRYCRTSISMPCLLFTDIIAGAAAGGVIVIILAVLVVILVVRKKYV